MATKNRTTRTSVKETLLEEVYRFNFFKAVHLLEGYGQDRALGKQLSPKDDPVRFRVKPSFVFPASDMLSIQNGHRHRDPVVTVNFMGLIGPKGVLPDWYNDHAQTLNHNKDYALTDFFDIFHHRIISLFYLAWKKYRIAENYRPDGSDAISKSLAGFIGMGMEEQKTDPDFDRVARRRLTYFAGMASRNVPTVAAVETVITNATGATAKVEQFVERMLPIHRHDRTCLGQANSTLNKDALCGSRVRDVTSMFLVALGPLSWKKYLAFQPHSRNLALLKKLITFIVGLEYEFKIRLIIKGREVPSLPLGGSKTGAPVLGRSVLLKWPGKPYRKDVVINEATRE